MKNLQWRCDSERSFCQDLVGMKFGVLVLGGGYFVYKIDYLLHIQFCNVYIETSANVG